VDRLEGDLGERALVLRLSVLSEVGQAAAARYGVRAVPTFVVFDEAGGTVAQSIGLPDRESLRDLLESLAEQADG
jgi:thioredoxin-like negative regulator of GroEL